MNFSTKHFFLIVIIFLVFPAGVFAQGSLFLSPSTGNYTVGESFSVLVNLSTGGESVNASAGQINFDNSRLQVVSLGYSQSIFTLWTENPTFSNPAGTITFSGGLPSPGFVGASGGVLRITFKVKAEGQAPVNFQSGSILANDGQGTNIAEGLRGAFFTLVEPQQPPKPIIVPISESEANVAERPLSTPIITDWPNNLSEGDTLSVKGLGYPLVKISVVIQKGTNDPVEGYTFSGPDGKFIYTYVDKVEPGFYRVYAKNIAADGNQSGLSVPVNVEVVAPNLIRWGGLILSYLTLILIIAVVIIIVLVGWFFHKRKVRKQMKEIIEAEHVLHHSFDNLKDGLTQYVTYLVSAKTNQGIKRREQKTKVELKEELENIEGKIKKEIEDIR